MKLTLEGILKGFHKTIDQLDQLSELNAQKAEMKDAQAQVLQLQSRAHQEEKEAAESVRNKLMDLVS